jgi:hypothetical protein
MSRTKGRIAIGALLLLVLLVPCPPGLAGEEPDAVQQLTKIEKDRVAAIGKIDADHRKAVARLMDESKGKPDQDQLAALQEARDEKVLSLEQDSAAKREPLLRTESEAEPLPKLRKLEKARKDEIAKAAKQRQNDLDQLKQEVEKDPKAKEKAEKSRQEIVRRYRMKVLEIESRYGQKRVHLLGLDAGEEMGMRTPMPHRGDPGK